MGKTKAFERHSDLLANAAIGTTSHTNSFTMQEKKESANKKKAATTKKASTKKEVIDKKEDPIKKEDSSQEEASSVKKEATPEKEDLIEKEDSTPKDDSIKKADSTQEGDSAKKEDINNEEGKTKKEEPVKKPHFSEKRIKEIVQRLKKEVAEFRQLQNEGKKPLYKRPPITVMEIPYVMLIIDRKRGVASKLMQEIRAELGKKPRQRITVTEFCKYTGIPISDVRDALYSLT